MSDIIPSFLDSPDSPFSPYNGGMLDNIRLRVGEVQELILPSDKRNLSKKFIEYRVFVQHRSNGTVVTKMYDHCILVNPFGGFADKALWTLRHEKTAAKKNDKGVTGVGKGAKVLLLCINGESHNAVIIGGIRDTEDSDTPAENLGHHLQFVFNGIDMSINDDGELKVSYTGKTKNDGTVDDSVDESAAGTAITFKKNGNLLVSSPDGSQSIEVDHENKQVAIQADQHWTVKSNGDMTLEASQAVTVKAAAVNIACAGGITMASGGVSTGSASDATLKGSTFRDSQSQMNQAMSSALTQLASSLSALVATLGATSAAAAAPGFSQVAAAAQAMASAIKNFEGQSSNYLSSKNKSD